MYKLIWGMIILSLNLLLTSCTTSNEISFKEVVKEINNYNENIEVPKVDLTKYINDIEDEEMLTYDEFDSFFKDYKGRNWQDGVDKELLKADLELYFRALRTNYGPYEYFGGDKAFNKVKDEAVEFIDSKDIILKYEIVDFLADKLSFVDDIHFFIGGRQTKKSIYMYLDKENTYLKDADGYYKVKNNKKYYIKSIDDNENIEENIKLSIDENGKLIYILYKMIENNSMYASATPLVMEVKSNIEFIDEEGEKNIEKVNLTTIKNYKKTSTLSTYNYEEKDSIPIIRMNSMPMEDNEDTIKFLVSAIMTKNKKVTVLDIRGNGGGRGELPVKWIEARFNKIVKSNSKGLYVNRLKEQPEFNQKFEENDFYKYVSLEKINDYFYKMKDKENEELVKNNKYIFLIIDKNTGSAGEYFIDLLRRVENVIVVGTNSFGVLNGSLYSYLILPNTGIEFGYGNWLRVYNDELFEEGRGFMPDIVVDGDEALDRVLDLISYYNLD